MRYDVVSDSALSAVVVGPGGKLIFRTDVSTRLVVSNCGPPRWPVKRTNPFDTYGAVTLGTWPHGAIQGEFHPAIDAPIVVVQRLTGSCPWLFAWNGRSMEFVTDCLWRSPLGLRINAQNTDDPKNGPAEPEGRANGEEKDPS